MHEYGVAVEIAEVAETSAGGRKILKINLRVGELSGIFAESLALYLEVIFREKQAGPVAVAFVKVPAVFACACGNRYAPEKIFDPCPECGGFDRTVVDGKECTVESIDVEE